MNWDKVEIQLGDFTMSLNLDGDGDYRVSLYGTFREDLCTPDFQVAQAQAIKSVRSALQGALVWLEESGDE